MAKALRSKLDALDEHLRDVRARRLQIVRLLEELNDEGTLPQPQRSYQIVSETQLIRAAIAVSS